MIPILSENLFGNRFMLQYYEPMQKMYYSVGEELTEGYVRRLNLVSKTIVETAIQEKDWYPQGYMSGVHGAYESVLHHLMYRRYEGGFGRLVRRPPFGNRRFIQADHPGIPKDADRAVGPTLCDGGKATSLGKPRR